MAEQVTKEAIKKLDSKLECSICLDTFKQPKLLPCYHVFCKSPCLEKLAAKDGRSLTCPTCRHIVPLSENGVSGLQSDFHIDHLFEIRDALNKAAESTERQCGSCEDGKATGYCRDCSEFVCDECIAVHKKLKKLKGHTLLSLEELKTEAASLVPPKRDVPRCQKHSNKKLKIYCETCKELICNDCTIRLHRDHHYDLVADVFLKHKEELVSSLTPVKQKLHTVQQALKAFDTRAKEVNDQRDTLQAHIHNQIDQLHQLLDQRRAQLLDELDVLTQHKLKSLAAQRDQVEITHVKLTSCLEYAEGGLQTGTEGQVLAMKAPVIERIQQISAEFDPNNIKPETKADLVLITGSKEQLEQTCQSYLEIADDQAMSIENSTLGGAGLTGAEVNQTAYIELQVNTHNGQAYTREATVVAAITNCTSKKKVDCDIVKDRDKYKISYKPRERGRHDLTLTISGRAVRGSPFSVVVMPSPRQLGKPSKVIGGLQRPWGIAMNIKHQIIVVEYGKGQITIYDEHFERLKSFDSHGKSPTEVTVDDTDNIYITDYNQHTVIKLTADGKLLSQVGSKGSGNFQFNNPCGICYNKSNGKLYVSDQYNHRIQVLNTDLTFHSSFGKRGSDEGELQHPTGITADISGNVYIADISNHRIQVFSANGTFLKMFGTWGNEPGQLTQPIAVTVSSTGVVFVTEISGHRISMFKTSGEFIRSFGEKGNKEGQFNQPAGILIDSHANIIVTERVNGRIQVF